MRERTPPHSPRPATTICSCRLTRRSSRRNRTAQRARERRSYGRFTRWLLGCERRSRSARRGHRSRSNDHGASRLQWAWPRYSRLRRASSSTEPPPLHPFRDRTLTPVASPSSTGSRQPCSPPSGGSVLPSPPRLGRAQLVRGRRANTQCTSRRGRTPWSRDQPPLRSLRAIRRRQPPPALRPVPVPQVPPPPRRAAAPPRRHHLPLTRRARAADHPTRSDPQASWVRDRHRMASPPVPPNKVGT